MTIKPLIRRALSRASQRQLVVPISVVSMISSCVIVTVRFPNVFLGRIQAQIRGKTLTKSINTPMMIMNVQLCWEWSELYQVSNVAIRYRAISRLSAGLGRVNSLIKSLRSISVVTCMPPNTLEPGVHGGRAFCSPQKA